MKKYCYPSGAILSLSIREPMKQLLLLSFAAFFLLTSCGPAEKGNENGNSDISDTTNISETERLRVFLDSTFDEAVSRDPQWESRLGIRTHYGEWSDYSDENVLKDIEIQAREFEEMQKRIDFDALDTQGKISYRLVETKVKRDEARKEFLYYSYPVEQMHGAQSELPSFLINVHRIDSVPDAEAYISRLRKMPVLMRQLVKKLETREALGIIPPQFVFPMVISDSRNIISGIPFDDTDRSSPLWEDFKTKVNDADFGEEDTERLLGEGKLALVDSVQLAYGLLIAKLESLQEIAGTDDGVWRFARGAQFYDYALQRTTTTDMNAEEIHDLGLREVARIHGEMKEIMAKVEFEGTLQEFFGFMRKDEQFYYSNDETGRNRYLTEATAVIDQMRETLPEFFGTLPKAPIEVKAVEPYREKSAGKAFYNRPAPDGSRPGTYYANLYDMANMPSYQMEALAFHEGIPGHHMQLAIAQELEGLPKFRKHTSFTAYIEGWALYCEFLAKEMGYYQDPYSDFGRLAMELWRACRLVVDTGIHSKKWTREEAIDYLKENTPNPEGDIVKAIERYIVMPSQATAYKIGMLKIQELRAKAEEAMGDKFDIRKFHDVVITNGAVPLDMLEELVDDYIKG